jgi:hypothetical protein
MYSGTTAVVVLLRDEKLYIANCGDSRAVMAKRNVYVLRCGRERATQRREASAKTASCPLFLCGRSGQDLGLSGGDPPNPRAAGEVIQCAKVQAGASGAGGRGGRARLQPPSLARAE